MEPEREEKVYDIFQSISGDYDRMNDVISLGMHRGWKRDLREAVCRRRPQRVLDVCCGTGDVALALAEALPAASVTGLDFSGEMLSVARRRRERNPRLVNLELLEGNAMALPFGEKTFDCVTISFGLRNRPDYGRAMQELVRVTRPGGAVFCLDSYRPDVPAVLPFYSIYFKRLVELEGRVLTGNGPAYRWLHDSTGQFLTKSGMRALMKGAGLEQIAMKRYLFGAAACHRGIRPED